MGIPGFLTSVKEMASLIKEIEETIERDVAEALVTENVVGSVTIPSSPPFE